MEGIDKNLTFNDYVRLSIDAKVEPLSLVFYPVTEFDSSLPFAFITETTLRSVILGDREEKTYTYVSDVKDIGLKLFCHNLRHVINALKSFDRKKKEVRFISTRCPSELVENADLYNAVSEILKDNPTINPERICITFPKEIMEKDFVKVKTAIADMKLLKVKTAITGCGSGDFLLSKLAEISPDVAILDPTATAYAGDRNKPLLLSSLISYVNGMGAEVIAKGTLENKKAMRGTDAIGFIDKDFAPCSLKDAINLMKEE